MALEINVIDFFNDNLQNTPTKNTKHNDRKIIKKQNTIILY